MNNQDSTINFGNKLFLYFFFLLIYTSPYLIRNFPSKIIIPISVLLALVLFPIKLEPNSKKIALYWFLLFVWQNLMWVIGHSHYNPLEILARFPMFMIPIVFCKLIERASEFNIRKVLVLSICLISINLLHNIFLGVFKSELFLDTESNHFYTSNAGSTVYGASLIFLVGAVLMFIKQNTRQLRTPLIVLSIGCIVYVLFLNTRATTILVLSLMILLMYLGRLTCRLKRGGWFYITSIIMALVIITLLAATILTYALQFFGGDDILVERFNDLLSFSEGDEISENGSFAQRLLLAGTSLKTFTANISNFIWGIGENNRGLSILELVQGGIGNHSEFIDCLARYGVIGAFFLYNAVIRTIKWVVNISSNRIVRYDLTGIYIAYIIYGFLNNVLFPDMMLVMFGVIPLMVRFMSLKNNINYK